VRLYQKVSTSASVSSVNWVFVACPLEMRAGCCMTLSALSGHDPNIRTTVYLNSQTGMVDSPLVIVSHSRLHKLNRANPRRNSFLLYFYIPCHIDRIFYSRWRKPVFIVNISTHWLQSPTEEMIFSVCQHVQTGFRAHPVSHIQWLPGAGTWNWPIHFSLVQRLRWMLGATSPLWMSSWHGV
jgi:hypothetical protein